MEVGKLWTVRFWLKIYDKQVIERILTRILNTLIGTGSLAVLNSEKHIEH